MDDFEKKAPQIGDDCILCVGCTILGNIHLVDNTIVAAGAVLLQSTESYSIYGGVPAHRIKSYIKQ
ncbi:MAG: hypothetical protein LBT59_30010 [Clostridiales bacterium]|nr:hypothetical protein [Clostridiales bacterium]